MSWLKYLNPFWRAARAMRDEVLAQAAIEARAEARRVFLRERDGLVDSVLDGLKKTAEK